MDIFRKKKIRKLLNELEDVNNILIQERYKTKKLQERINNLEKNINTNIGRKSNSYRMD